jgi:hypothetical protein
MTIEPFARGFEAQISITALLIRTFFSEVRNIRQTRAVWNDIYLDRGPRHATGVRNPLRNHESIGVRQKRCESL